MDKTGFHAYWFYTSVKHAYFNSKKFDITNMKLPKRGFHLKKWNEEKKDKDGILFFKVEKFLPPKKDKFIKIFAYYYIQNQNFYITDILNDEFNLYKQNEYELRNIEKIFETDLLYVLSFCRKNNVKFKNVFRSKGGLPVIFKIYERKKISVHSLIVFNEIFSIEKNITEDDLDIIEKEKFSFFSHKVFDRYQKIITKDIAGTNWKDLTKKIIKGD